MNVVFRMGYLVQGKSYLDHPPCVLDKGTRILQLRVYRGELQREMNQREWGKRREEKEEDDGCGNLGQILDYRPHFLQKGAVTEHDLRSIQDMACSLAT